MKILGRYIFERRPRFLTEDLVISSELQSVVDSLNNLDSAKQDLLVSGLNIKTINGHSILGTGDISIVSSLFKFSATNYSALLLVTGAVAGDLAYVYNSQGTAILPGNWGGTYYDKGAYVFDGVNWIDDNDITNKTLQESIDSLNLLAVDVALLYTNKVDKIAGKQLSTEDYTTAEKNKLASISGSNTGDETTVSIQTKRPLKTVNGDSLEGSGNVVISSSVNTLGSKTLSSIAQNPNAIHDKWHFIFDNTSDSYTLEKDYNSIGFALVDTLSALNTLSYADEETQVYFGTTWGKQTSLGDATSYVNLRRFTFVNNANETISILYSDFTEAYRLEPYNTVEIYLIDKSTANGTWIFNTKRPTWLNEFFDNFIAGSTAGQTNWTVSGGTTQLFSSVGNPTGGLTLTTGNTEAGVGVISKNLAMIQLGTNQGVTVVEFRFRVTTLSDATQEYNVRIGLGDLTTNGDFTDGVYLEYDRSLSGDVWRVKTASNNSRSRIVSTVAVDTSWHHAKIEINNLGTNAWFFIDDVLVGTIGSNLPTGVGRQTTLIAKINKTVGTTARTLNIDHVNFRNYYN